MQKCAFKENKLYSISFSTEIYPSGAKKDVQGRLQMASGRSALGQNSSRAPPQAGAGSGSQVPVPQQLGWLCHKRTGLATLTQDILQQAKLASNKHLTEEDPPPLQCLPRIPPACRTKHSPDLTSCFSPRTNKTRED